MSGTTKSPTIGLASADGVQGLLAVTNGQAQQIACDLLGRLWTVAAPVTSGPEPLRTTTAGAPVLQTPVITPIAGQPLRLQWAGAALAGGGGARVLMVFDSAVPLVGGEVPVWRQTILDGGAGVFNSVDYDFGNFGGIVFTAGIVLALSTTLPTLTLPGAAEGFFQTIHTNV